MATHAGVALELGIKRPGPSGGSGIKMMSPQMEAILIWCQCRVRDYVSVNSSVIVIVEIVINAGNKIMKSLTYLPSTMHGTMYVSQKSVSISLNITKVLMLRKYL